MQPDDEGHVDKNGAFTVSFVLEAPAGLIDIKALCKNGKVLRVTLKNTASFLDPTLKNLTVQVPLSISRILRNEKALDQETQSVNVDIAYGGMWYVIVDVAQLKQFGFDLVPAKGKDIVRLGEVIKVAAREQFPTNLNQYTMDGTVLMDYAGAYWQ